MSTIWYNFRSDGPHSRLKIGQHAAQWPSCSPPVCRTRPSGCCQTEAHQRKRGTAMATVYVVTAGSGESYHIERVYLDSDQAYRFAQDYNGIAPVKPVSVEEWQAGAPPAAYDGPYWRAEWWARASGGQASRGAAAYRRGRTVRRLRHPPGVVDRRGAARGQSGAPGTGRRTEDRGRRAIPRRRSRRSSGRRSPRLAPNWRECPGNNFRYLCRKWNEMGMAVRHCRPHPS